MDQISMVAKLEHVRIAPQPTVNAAGTTLPVTLFDIVWMHMPPVQRLVFYQLPSSRTHFVESIIPNLKHSLALALKHFPPLAGNLFVPSDFGERPQIRYMVGDSVSLTFAESIDDFNNLTANFVRNAEDFYSLVPQLPESTETPDSLLVPVLALQVTLFPNSGLCIGITNHHSVGDASSIFNFMRAWASINKFDGDEVWLSDGSLPLYDRNLIQDPKELWKVFHGRMGKITKENLPGLPTPKGKVRVTLVFDKAQIQELKRLVSTKRTMLKHVSTFTVLCGYVWSFIVKSRHAVNQGEKTNTIDEMNELEFFGLAADCRARLDPPVPANYFGNCLVYCLTSTKAKELVEDEESFVEAADLIGEAIQERMYHEKGVLQDAENWFSGNWINGSDTGTNSMNFSKVVGVAGSPKYNYYDLDFGWGKACKFEFISIDSTGAIALSGRRESDGGIEVGLSLSKHQMDHFVLAVASGVKSLGL